MIKPGEIFVFGSNLCGIHGAGAAKTAMKKYGAVYGCGEGPQGRAYAIPTKLTPQTRLALSEIKYYVEQFVRYAKYYVELDFLVTRVGCGLAGYRDSEIAPMFADAPPTCTLDNKWSPFLESAKCNFRDYGF